MTAPSDDREQYGTRLAPGYRVLGLLQRGRDFETYDAWSERRYARCVVKTMCRSGRSKDNRARLVQEGKLLTALDHPHLVRGYEVRVRPRTLVVMETLTGSTLDHILKTGRRLTLGEVAHLGAHLSSALRYLHAQGVLHLDVKPGNVIIGGGRARLIDLSLAQPPGPIPAGRGTPAYLSPEQGIGGVVSSPTDVWGLGLTLFVAATGVSPFSRGGASSEVAASGNSPGPGSRNDRCRTCGRRMSYLQLTNRAPRAGSLRRMSRTLSGALDACLEPSPASRPTLAELDQTFNALAGSDRPTW
jgi:serine/threonine protein kinase